MNIQKRIQNYTFKLLEMYEVTKKKNLQNCKVSCINYTTHASVKLINSIQLPMYKRFI